MTLFQPITIGSITVKNRFVRSATHDRLGNDDGSISDQQLQLYKTLAQHQVGLIITGHAYVSHPHGKASIRQNAIYHDRFISGYRRLAQAVHPFDTKLIMQISHAGRQTSPDLIENNIPLAPSAVIDGSTGISPQAMTEIEILQLIEDFSLGIQRAKQSDCDGVQLHLAHGYGLSQFLSPYTNRREDKWGGTIENRTLILREIIRNAKQLVGDNFPILVKLNTTDGFSGPGYLTLDDVLYTVSLLENLGACAIEVSGGIREAQGVMSKPNILEPEQEAYFAPTSQKIKQISNIPVILVGGLRSLKVMQRVVKDGVADMVALSRPFIKEPDLISRFLNNQPKAECISCNACFKPVELKCHYNSM